MIDDGEVMHFPKKFYFFLAMCTVANIGRTMTQYALGVNVIAVTLSASSYALTSLAFALPICFFSPVVGYLIDRFRPARALVAVWAIRAAILTALIAISSGTFDLAAVFFIAVLLGSTDSIMPPALSALLKESLGDRSFNTGLASMQFAAAFVVIAGPPVGVYLFEKYGFEIVPKIDFALSCVAFVALLAATRFRHEDMRFQRSKRSAVEELVSGWAEIIRSTDLRYILGFVLVNNSALSVLSVLLIPTALMLSGPKLIGMILAGNGIGIAVASLFAAKAGWKPEPRVMSWATSGQGLTIVALSIWISPVAAVVCSVVTGTLAAATQLSSDQYWLGRVRANVRGRVLAARSAIAAIGTPLGLILAVAAMDFFLGELDFDRVSAVGSQFQTLRISLFVTGLVFLVNGVRAKHRMSEMQIAE